MSSRPDAASASEPPFFEALKWTADGLIPAIAQDAESGEILMMAWMNEAALRATWRTKRAHYYSRSRDALWLKGGTSGHLQHLEAIRLDCDGDVLLLTVRQIGGACHEGYRSCFFRTVRNDGRLEVVGDRVFDPKRVYESASQRDGAPPA